MTNKNTASMMDNLTSKIIYTGKEYITRNELPSGYRFMEYDWTAVGLFEKLLEISAFNIPFTYKWY